MSGKLLPISEYQQRFFLEWALAPEDNTYNIALVYKIKGNLDKSKLIQACDIFSKKHEILHVRYSEDGGKCYYENYDIKDFFHEVELDPNKDINLQLRSLLDKHFNLTYDVLLQFILIKNSGIANEYYFIGPMAHHIIADAYSASVCVKELSESYNLLINKHSVSTNVDKTFTEAVKSVQQTLTFEYKQKAREYWLNFITDFPLNINLPYKSGVNPQYLNNKFTNKKGEFIYFDLNEQETQYLKKYARQNRSTLFILLSAIYGLVISKYSNQSKLLLSYPINMRPKGCLGVTGCFVNNVPLKIDLEQNETLDDLIASLVLQRKESKDYQGYSLTHIIEDQRKYNQIEVGEVLNVGFAHTNLNVLPLRLEGLKTEAIDIPWSSDIAYRLDLQYDDNVINSIKFRLGYQKDLFKPILIKAFIDSFKELISKIVSKKLINCKTYCALDTETYNKVIYQYNDTEKEYPQDKTIQELFEEQVTKTPNNIAAVYEDIQLSYNELNQESNHLAHYLRDKYQIKGDNLIALCLDRSEYMLIAILAVLKSGGAYVPMDPGYPEDRINFILNDTNAKVLITTTHYENVLRHCEEHRDVAILSIDNNELKQTLRKYPRTNTKLNINSSNLAYVIYTSGTTGTPKGVMIEHSSVLNYIYAIKDKFSLTKQDYYLLFQEYVFDSTVTSIYGSLLCGGRLFLLDKAYKDNAQYVSNYIVTNKINFVKSTPTYLDVMCLDERIFISYCIKNKVKIVIGGEPVSYKIINKLRHLSNQGKLMLYNHYGPTEITVGNSCCSISTEGIWELFSTNPIIGTNLNNYTSYILDSNSNLLPLGGIGELYIGGAGLSRGYLNLPELTNELFLANPFQTESEKLFQKNARIYKTGDLVRMLADGNIEYLGRNDFQVKIRGYRIELFEIESQLAIYPEVKQAVVLAVEHLDTEGNATGNKYLVAYYVAETKLDESAILNYLNQELPDYMVPSILVYLDKLPLTINGKLDRKALPNPEFIDTSAEYIVPRDELDKSLVEVFASVLGLDADRLSINADFFHLGGNSILAIKLVSHINKHIPSAKLSVADIFKYKNTQELSDYIKHESYNKNSLIKLMNDASSSQLLFMIHPSMAGCEVYFELANLLANDYKCYGVDNYNIQNNEQITNLYELANLYLLYIEEVRMQNNIEAKSPYYLLGLSLGGQIVLAIASILEARGISNINIFCLDTVLSDGDKTIMNLRLKNEKELDRESLYKNIMEYQREKYGDESYAKNVLKAMDSELLVAKGFIRHKLIHTSILLFKATKLDERSIKDTSIVLNNHVLKLPYNNINNIIANEEQLRVVNLDCSHGNILGLSFQIRQLIMGGKHKYFL